MMQCIDEYLGFALFKRNVVADFGGIELATLIALPNREDINDLGMRGLYRKDLTRNLFVGLKRAGPQLARAVGAELANTAPTTRATRRRTWRVITFSMHPVRIRES